MNLDTAESALLTDNELRERLRCSWRTFYRLLNAKKLECFAVPRPLTPARWSRAKVESYERGESLTKFGRGSRS